MILVLSVIDRESFNRASRTYKTTVEYFKNSIYNGINKAKISIFIISGTYEQSVRLTALVSIRTKLKSFSKPSTDLPMPVAVVLNKIDLRDDKPQSIQERGFKIDLSFGVFSM